MAIYVDDDIVCISADRGMSLGRPDHNPDHGYVILSLQFPLKLQISRI